ncbi:uncharacterized protein LOC124184826 [Neodiprion fabricii]|uniref:uncharacterized protein LOC124184826 n=1 Tax=Neodiprion fabricii TaxID=2872261 RepID=UPI001ED965BF|nr:uncharacterized protein LOC124184826 [Neodiprion fabricii]XP_046430887.1 uncharacterized protein LOC124184826 [Neodiprion fabricii]
MSASITDIPDEILMKIILYAELRERVAFGSSCRRFDYLVFGEPTAERELDFSREGWLTEVRHVESYFCNENNCENVRKVNMANVICVTPGRMLNSTIGKAVNLVDLNIHKTKFKTLFELSSFLDLLIHVTRLSIDWPTDDKGDFDTCLNLLKRPFSKLVYLSVSVLAYNPCVLPMVSQCDVLEELRLKSLDPPGKIVIRSWWRRQECKPENIKIIQVRGWDALGVMKDHLVSILENYPSWIDFEQLCMKNPNGFYLEKNVPIHDRLRAVKLTERYRDPWYKNFYVIGWTFLPEVLLPEVINLTHVNAPENYCCLHQFRVGMNLPQSSCHLKVEEAKRLLADPNYQITFLLLKHVIEVDCDAHLLISAFPNLTQLVLYHVTKLPMNGEKKDTWLRRLNKRGQEEFHEYEVLMDLEDSSFKLLVENSPNVTDVTFHSKLSNNSPIAMWDLGALYFIPNWKKLTTLRLAYIPIQDGQALIHIALNCPHLHTLIINCLGWIPSCNYTEHVARVVAHCRTLKVFSWEQNRVTELYNVFDSLVVNEDLENVRVTNERGKTDVQRLATSVVNLIRNCRKLRTFKCVSYDMITVDSDHMISKLRRLKTELDRPFQFQLLDPQYHVNYSSENIDLVHYDCPESNFSDEMDWMNFTSSNPFTHGNVQYDGP